ncbi:hypothetical protein [Paenibacillus campi]|uniref:hypothetical protein n=1 Tax=Paenibacillus campi TaxID=3106031 RepID=UPI002AFE6A14|nr:hypothetical protein [Paenibacillus sp. SGZ-1014]
MKFKKAKLFFKDNKINLVEYTVGTDYYEFIKQNSQNGYEQIILTTDFMLAIIKYYFIERRFNISEIVPVDEDEFLVNKFKYYLEKIEENREQFMYLLSEMDFLFYEKNALDIFKIELSGKTLDEKRMRFSAQINGIIIIDENSYEKEKKVICNIVAGHLGCEV